MKMQGFPGGTSGKESACQCRRHKRHGFHLQIRKIPWRRKWEMQWEMQPTLVFLPGESPGQRSLVGYSPWAAKSWTWLSMCTCTHEDPNAFSPPTLAESWTVNSRCEGNTGSLELCSRPSALSTGMKADFALCYAPPSFQGHSEVIVHLCKPVDNFEKTSIIREGGR